MSIAERFLLFANVSANQLANRGLLYFPGGQHFIDERWLEASQGAWQAAVVIGLPRRKAGEVGMRKFLTAPFCTEIRGVASHKNKSLDLFRARRIHLLGEGLDDDRVSC